MYIYLYKVKQYLEIKLHISFEQILVNQFRHPVDIATRVKCKIYRERKKKSQTVREVPAIVNKNHNIVVCLTLIKVF